MSNPTLRQLGWFGMDAGLPTIDAIGNPVVIAAGANNIAEGGAVPQQNGGSTDQATDSNYADPGWLFIVAVVILGMLYGPAGD